MQVMWRERLQNWVKESEQAARDFREEIDLTTQFIAITADPNWVNQPLHALALRAIRLPEQLLGFPKHFVQSSLNLASRLEALGRWCEAREGSGLFIYGLGVLHRAILIPRMFADGIPFLVEEGAKAIYSPEETLQFLLRTGFEEPFFMLADLTYELGNHARDMFHNFFLPATQRLPHSAFDIGQLTTDAIVLMLSLGATAKSIHQAGARVSHAIARPPLSPALVRVDGSIDAGAMGHETVAGIGMNNIGASIVGPMYMEGSDEDLQGTATGSTHLRLADMVDISLQTLDPEGVLTPDLLTRKILLGKKDRSYTFGVLGKKDFSLQLKAFADFSPGEPMLTVGVGQVTPQMNGWMISVPSRASGLMQSIAQLFGKGKPPQGTVWIRTDCHWRTGQPYEGPIPMDKYLYLNLDDTFEIYLVDQTRSQKVLLVRSYDVTAPLWPQSAKFNNGYFVDVSQGMEKGSISPAISRKHGETWFDAFRRLADEHLSSDPVEGNPTIPTDTRYYHSLGKTLDFDACRLLEIDLVEILGSPPISDPGHVRLYSMYLGLYSNRGRILSLINERFRAVSLRFDELSPQERHLIQQAYLHLKRRLTGHAS